MVKIPRKDWQLRFRIKQEMERRGMAKIAGYGEVLTALQKVYETVIREALKGGK